MCRHIRIRRRSSSAPRLVAIHGTPNVNLTTSFARSNSTVPLLVIGDAVAPRRAVLTVYEGRRIGMAF